MSGMKESLWDKITCARVVCEQMYLVTVMLFVRQESMKYPTECEEKEKDRFISLK